MEFIVKISYVLLGLLIASATTTQAIDPIASIAAGLSWLAIAPITSLLVNIVPSPITQMGEWLLGNTRRGIALRCVGGGTIGGTIGTLAAVYVYNKIAAK